MVTGACGKLGPVWVEALLEAGARVAALDLPGAPPSDGDFAALEARAPLKVAAVRLRHHEPRVHREPPPRRSRRAWGARDVLVNNAGVDQPPDVRRQPHRRIDDLPIEQFRRMSRSTCWAPSR